MPFTSSPLGARPCPLEMYLDVLSGSWVVRILWLLFEPAGPRRFAELQRGLRGISAKVLTQKLRRLEREGLLQREIVGGNLPQVSYHLTPRGLALLPVFRAIEAASRELFPTDGQADAAAAATPTAKA